MTDLIIEIPIKTDCDPSVLLDLAIEASEQFADEIRMHDGEATVDEEEVLVRPAGLTIRERDLLAALESILMLAESPIWGPQGQAMDRKITATHARAAIAKAGGAK